MNTYKLLVVASVLFPCLMHAMHGTPQKHDSRAPKRAAQWATPTKKSKQRKMRAQQAVAFNCTHKKHQASTHIIEASDFKLPAAARGNA